VTQSIKGPSKNRVTLFKQAVEWPIRSVFKTRMNREGGAGQQLSLNSWAIARSGCGALRRVLGKRNWCIHNRKSFSDPFPDVSERLGLPAGFFSRGAAESAEVEGRRIGFSPRTPRLRVRLFLPLIHGSALMLPNAHPGSVFQGFHLTFFPSGNSGRRLLNNLFIN
jgi:hypothetical protein